jgi:hypothetical protein
MKSDRNRPISIEDLLRLKCAERPPPEFWATFDQQLRAKQLAALVAKRPWWQRLPRVLPAFSRYRYHLPLGATAVLAITFITLHEFGSAPRATVRQPHVQPVPTAADSGVALKTSSARLATATVAQHVEPPVPVPSLIQSAIEPTSTSAAPAETLASAATAPGELARMIPLLGAPAAEPVNDTSPAARTIAENLAGVQTNEPLANRGLLATTHGFDAGNVAARPAAAVEPLQQLTPPSDTRRSRILTAMVAMTSMDMSARVTERTASRIDEERLYERVRRFGAQGDRLNVKF